MSNNKQQLDKIKRELIGQIQEEGRKILAIGFNPMIRCEDKDAEEQMERELALKKEKEAALGDAEHRLEEYMRGIYGKA